MLFSAPAIWKGKWAFVATDRGTDAWLLRGGRLHAVWSNGNGGTSPVVAGNLLYVAGNGAVNVYVPTSGRLVATLPSGAVHWQSPIVAGGLRRHARGERERPRHKRRARSLSVAEALAE